MAAPIPEAELFGKTLRKLRQAKELTQERLAGAAGLTTGYVNTVERGMQVPSLTTILKLAHALGVTPSELLSDFTSAAVRRLVG
ncbi:MAG TPA: helix-turn-helix transcriptional regulator [Thermoanaerobaculia bacterium]